MVFEVDHLPPSNPEVEDEYSYTSPACPYDVAWDCFNPF